MRNGTYLVIDSGSTVICDFCNTDVTNSEVSGGFLFGSAACCPDCEDRMLSNIDKHGERVHIREWCPKGTSFSDWIRDVRTRS